MKTIYSWQTVNLGNLAEQVCRPVDYVDLGCEVKVLDQNCPESDFKLGPVIFGASGLLYPEIAPTLERAVCNKLHPMIAWGIGHNTHGGSIIDYPDWLDLFDAVGLRDYGTPWNYVPCPSCLSPVFDIDYGRPDNPLVIYDQIDYPVAAKYTGVPRENNLHGAADLPRIIRFLASGEKILTSSYHGAYWGMLLGRKVVLWTPWSTKFRTFRKVPPIIHSEVWPLPEGETGGDDYLKDCRERNFEFSEKVMALLDITDTCNPLRAGVKLRL